MAGVGEAEASIGSEGGRHQPSKVVCVGWWSVFPLCILAEGGGDAVRTGIAGGGEGVWIYGWLTGASPAERFSSSTRLVMHLM